MPQRLLKWAFPREPICEAAPAAAPLPPAASSLTASSKWTRTRRTSTKTQRRPSGTCCCCRPPMGAWPGPTRLKARWRRRRRKRSRRSQRFRPGPLRVARANAAPFTLPLSHEYRRKMPPNGSQSGTARFHAAAMVGTRGGATRQVSRIPTADIDALISLAPPFTKPGGAAGAFEGGH